jgi:hypothetical protein
MKIKAIILSAIFSILLTVQCYGESPDYAVDMGIIFLIMVIVFGVILGFLVKVVLFYSRIESAKNWQIFLGSIIAAGLILIMIFK